MQKGAGLSKTSTLRILTRAMLLCECEVDASVLSEGMGRDSRGRENEYKAIQYDEEKGEVAFVSFPKRGRSH